MSGCIGIGRDSRYSEARRCKGPSGVFEGAMGCKGVGPFWGCQRVSGE